MTPTLQDPVPTDMALASPPLHVAEVALAVRDLARVTAFYRDVVGLSVMRSEDGVVDLGAGGVRLLQLLHRPQALPDHPASAGLFHTAFLLPARADLGRWLAHARDAGIKPGGAADHLVSEAVYLSDPEGNGVEIYADRPAAHWSWTGPAEARQIEMANQPLDGPGLLALADRPWDMAPPGTRIGHVHLRVGDVPQAISFYTDVLGLDVTRVWPEAAFLSTGGYHHHIAANVWRSRGAGLRDPARAGLACITMQAADTAIARAIARRGRAEDLAGTGMQDPWGTRIRILSTIQH